MGGSSGGGGGSTDPFTVAGSAISGGAKSVGGDIATGVKSWGKGFSDMNPFKKPPTYGGYDVQAPDKIVAPKAPTSGVQVQGMPTTLQGGQIQAPGNVAAAQINTQGQQQFAGFQTDLLNQLAAQARGQGPSLAAQQLQAGTDANIAASMAALASARGGSNPALARQVIGQSADLRQQAAQQSAMARLQEQLQAQGLLGQVAGQAREQEIGLATSQAALDQEAALTNYKGQLEVAVQQGILDQRTAEQLFQAQVQESMKNADLGAQFQELQAKYAAMGLDADKANMLAALEVEKMKMGDSQAQYDSLLQGDMLQKQLVGGLLGAGGQIGAAVVSSRGTAPPGGAAAGGEAAAASDRALKTEIRSGDKDIEEFLSAVQAHHYKYKDPKWGKGSYVSPMAQELEKSKLGKDMVIDTDEGKIVDYGKGLGALLAAQANLHKRLKKIEGK